MAVIEPKVTTQIAPGLPGGPDPAFMGVGNQTPASALPVQPVVITSADAAKQAAAQTANMSNVDRLIWEEQQKITEQEKAKVAPKQEMMTVYNPKGVSTTAGGNEMQIDKNNLGIWQAAGWSGVKPTAPIPGSAAGGGAVKEGDIWRFPDGSFSYEDPNAGNAVRYNADGTPFTGSTTAPGAPAPVDNSSAIAQQLEANQTKADAAQKAFEDSLNQIRNGTFPLTPDQQAQLDGITNSYKALIEEQKIANQNFTTATTQAGISSGRNIYAPEIELGNIKSTVDQGIKKVMGIQSEMLAAVAKAKQAILDNDVKLLDMAYKSYTDLQKSQRESIMDLNTLTQQAIENARADHAAALDQARFDFDVEKEANKPLLEADKRIQDTVADLVLKYPDAGIDMTDTLKSASEKVKASASYKAELEKAAADAKKATQGGVPIFRPAAPDRFGNPQYQQWNPTTQTWDLSTSEQVDSYTQTALDGTDSYSQSVNGAVENIVSNLQVESQRGTMRRDIAVAMQQGNPQLVVDKVMRAAKDTLGQEEKARLNGNEKALVLVPGLQTDIQLYLDGGGELSFLKGLSEDAAKAIGLTLDPNRRKLSSEVLSFLLDYRKSQTGAAFSEKETQEYKDLLASIKESPTLANAKLDGFLKAKQDDVNATYGMLLGPENWTELKKIKEAGYENTIDRSEYDKMVSQVGKEAADKIMRDNKTWLVDPPKASGGAVSDNNATGSLSEKYESGGDPGAVGYDKVGGLSYGTYQLAHNNAKSFVEQSPYSEEFSGLTFNSKQWQDKWKEVAKKDPEGFKSAQRGYIEQTHITPQMNRLAKAGIDTSKFSPVLKDVIWSTAVQHGGNTDVVEKVMKRLGPNASEKDIIKAIYDERWSGGSRFASSTPEVQKAVQNRFFGPQGELNTALSRLG